MTHVSTEKPVSEDAPRLSGGRHASGDGKKPRTTDGIDLDDRLSVIAAGVNASASDHEEADHAS